MGLQDELGNAILSTIQGTASRWPVEAVSAGRRAEYGEQFQKYTDGAKSRLLVKPLPSTPDRYSGSGDTARTPFLFELQLDGGPDPQDKQLLRTKFDNAVRSTFGDTGKQLFTIFADTGNNTLGGARLVIVGEIRDEEQTRGSNHFRRVAAITVRLWHKVPETSP